MVTRKVLLVVVGLSLVIVVLVRTRIASSKDFASVYGKGVEDVKMILGKPDSEAGQFYAAVPESLDDEIKDYIYSNVTGYALYYGGTVIEFNAKGRVYRIYGNHWLK